MDRQLLARATENSDAPTPGYMYLDIAKNAASNPATCADIAKYLTGRLGSKNNQNIKFKCLKVISKTCTSPYLRGQFKRCLSQDPNAMTAIKEALQFRGPPDPVRGDEPYERVRTAAKEALDAVYSDTPQDHNSGGGGQFATSVSSSYGPSPHQQQGGAYGGYGGGGGAPAGGGAREMQGIGNPMFSDPRMDPPSSAGGIANMTIKNVVNEAKHTVIGMIKDPLARNSTIHVGAQNGSMPRPGGSYGGPGAYSNPPPGRSELMQQTGGQWTMASNRGPSAVGPPANYGNDAAYYKSRDNGSNNAYAWAQKDNGGAGGVGGSWASAASNVASQTRQPYEHQATPSITVNSISGGVVPPVAGGGAAVSDGSYERQLILELCPPGGMKAEPPPDKLNQFSRSVANLNPDLVCPALLDCLEEGQPWVIRAKALWVIEACVKHGQKPAASTNAYTDFFHACSGEIAPLTNHNRVQIREPAKRVLNLMGVATPVSGTAAPPVAAPPAAAPPAPVINLLDFDDGITPAPPVATPAPPAGGGGASLFGGLNVVAPSAPPPQAPPATPPAAPPPQPNLLGDFLCDATPAPAPVGGGSFFGDMNVKSAAPAPRAVVLPVVTQAASLFDSMSLKTEVAPTAGAAPVAAEPSGSAFGFINSSASMETTEQPKATSTIPGAQSRDSFDPLKNMTPKTAQKMMQMSPEQMQAMAYQQMMMQQQMQMAQMQMAMQQQRRGSSGMFMPGVMQNQVAGNATSVAFMDQPARTQDKTFDFVQDAMTMEKKK